MTTESRMRVEVKFGIAHVFDGAEHIANCGEHDKGGLDKANRIAEALSPPARRTSYEWVDEYGVDCRVRRSGSAWISEWAVGDPEQWVEFGHPAAAGAIATLANLTPPEEDEHG